MAAYKTGSASTTISAVPVMLFGLSVVGGSDAATYEVRDGTSDSDPLVDVVTAAPGTSTHFSVPHFNGVPLKALRVVKIAGSGSVFVAYYI
jgi:hypothetical protein